MSFDRKAYTKKWYENNKEIVKERAKEWGKQNPEKKSAAEAKYKKKNRGKVNQQSKEYRNNNPEKWKITQWKTAGMKDSDWDLVYKTFQTETNCWICGIEYDEIFFRKCLDHDHDDGDLRYICCSSCNLHIVG